jgi:hypothetical protein
LHCQLVGWSGGGLLASPCFRLTNHYKLIVPREAQLWG